MKKPWTSTALGIALAVAFAVTPARAQNVDDRIQALEQELMKLKTEQAQTRVEQMELKKDAEAAAAALPNFSYRPGNGVLVEAADKAWSVRFSTEAHMRMLFESGRDEVGRTSGEIMGRRLRPYFYYCVNNCFVETEIGLDLDGFGTGNGKNSTNDPDGANGSMLQRAAVHLHFENLNPWFPTFTTGMDISTSAAATASRQGSSDVGVQREYDILSRQAGPNTGRAGQGITLTWDDRSLSGIGIPGRISRFQVGRASVNEADDGLSSFSSHADYTAYLGIQPFATLKNKWLTGMTFEVGAWFCNNRGYDTNVDNGCDRIRLRDHGDGGSQTLFDTGANTVGKGWYTYWSPGFNWTIGPYRLRTIYGHVNAEDDDNTVGAGANAGRDKKAKNFLIGHDLFLWSPKGFLTGSPTTSGSILVGYSFERNDASCDTCTGGHFGQFHRNRVLLNQWGIAYFFGPRQSILANVLWYDASNLRVGAGQACHNLDICNNGNGRPGRGGDWVDGSITLRVSF
jgi:hypothetical protein